MSWYSTIRRGFTIVELLVVVAVIIILSAISVKMFETYFKNVNDKDRQVSLQYFMKQLELYKTDHGSYVCGDACQNVNGSYYSIDCSSEPSLLINQTPPFPLPANASLLGDVPALERNGFLNGGNCCASNGGYPLPTGSSDDITWGLYSKGYLPTSTPRDPTNADYNFYNPNYAGSALTKGSEFFYCYATPAQGRNSFALFARMQNNSLNSSDSPSRCSTWYEVYSTGYPANGWTPNSIGWVLGRCSNNAAWTCASNADCNSPGFCQANQCN